MKKQVVRAVEELVRYAAVVLLTLAGWLVADYRFGERAGLSAQEEWAYTRPTASMLPCMGSDDRYKLTTNLSRVVVGDVITYVAGDIEEEEHRVMHRVMLIIRPGAVDPTKTYYVVQGDNNPYPDPFLVEGGQLREKLLEIRYG